MKTAKIASQIKRFVRFVSQPHFSEATHFPFSDRLLGSPVPGVFRIFKRLGLLRACLKQLSPDIVISFNDVTNVMTLLALVGTRLPVIVGERNDPCQHPLKQPWRMLRCWTYRRAASVVCQTRSALNFFPELIRYRGKVIPNPVQKTDPQSKKCLLRSTGSSKRILLAMGRLSAQKGFDLLIDAFAGLAAKHSDWILEIWGAGSELEDLKRRVLAAGLSERIQLSGFTANPVETMRRADIFVLSSRYEGFPNVLCEAMSGGLPVVSFDCPSGPAEIIRHDIDGILVPPANIEALSNALDQLMSNETERLRLAAHAVEISERFSMEKVMGWWADLVMEAVRRNNHEPVCQSTESE